MGSCSDFLTTDPPTDVTDTNFYRTTGDAYKALVGCYDGLQIIWSGGGLPVYTEVLSDNAFAGGGYYDGYGYSMLDEFDKSVSPSDQSMFATNWTDYYKAIYRCNVFLQKMNQMRQVPALRLWRCPRVDACLLSSTQRVVDGASTFLSVNIVGVT